MIRCGRVVSFDAASGLGEVESDGETLPLHAAAIADGTRTIEVGATVTFIRQPGRAGRWEAAEVIPS